jgi:hypothetical protein
MSTINRYDNDFNDGFFTDPDPVDDHKKRGETKIEFINRRKKEKERKDKLARKLLEIDLDKKEEEPKIADEYDSDEIDCTDFVKSKPKSRKIEKASPGSIRVKSRGPEDFRLITDDGSIIDLPVVSAMWEIECGKIPTVTLVLEAEIDANGCEVKINTGRKTIPIEEFLKQRKAKDEA